MVSSIETKTQPVFIFLDVLTHVSVAAKKHPILRVIPAASVLLGRSIEAAFAVGPALRTNGAVLAGATNPHREADTSAAGRQNHGQLAWALWDRNLDDS